MNRRVLVVGDLAVDVVALLAGPLATDSDTAARISYAGGGAGANVAAGLATLDVPVTLVTRVGDDALGRQSLADLAAIGVDLAVPLDATTATGTVIVLVDPDGERSMVPDRGANRLLDPADLPDELMATATHLHLSGYVLLDHRSEPAAQHALARARAHGLTVSVDPASAAPLAAYGPDRFLTATAGADLLLPNAVEARLLAGTADVAAAARILAERYADVVVSCGRDGAIWASGGRTGRVPAPPVAVVDTTGAGDAFTAAVVAAWLGGAGLLLAAEAGVRSGAAAVGRPGARPS